MKSLEEIHPYISIHALLAESDAHQNRINKSLPYFYPRSPCGERQCWKRHKCRKSQKFLSTLSLRRATDKVLEAVSRNGISIHALLAESDDLHRGEMVLTARISIHALLAESDRATSFAVSVAENFYPRSPCGERPISIQCITPSGQFLSTLSLRRATQGNTSKFFGVLFLSTLSLRRATGVSTMDNGVTQISIHALLAESDGTGR